MVTLVRVNPMIHRNGGHRILVASAHVYQIIKLNLKFLFWRGGGRKKGGIVQRIFQKDSSCPFSQKIIWKIFNFFFVKILAFLKVMIHANLPYGTMVTFIHRTESRHAAPNLWLPHLLHPWLTVLSGKGSPPVLKIKPKTQPPWGGSKKKISK